MRNWSDEIYTGLDAEGCIALIEEALGCVESVPSEFWARSCDALVEVGKSTWWRCHCGVLNPLEGVVDAFCVRCGEMRCLGDRLSRSPWVLYVHCVRRVYAEDWFDRLSSWALGCGILDHEETVVAESGAYLGVSPDSGAGVAAYGGAIAAQGASPCAEERIMMSSSWTEESETSPCAEERILVMIDGMRISSLGYVMGTQWIALPMPFVCALEGKV